MKVYVRSLLTALVVAVMVMTFAVGVVAPRMPRVVGPPADRQTRHFVRPNADLVRVQNADGSVQVRTHQRATVECLVEIRAYGLTAAADATAEAYVDSLIEVSASDGVLEIETEPGERPDDIDVIAEYSLLVPVGTNVDIRSANGNVWISKGCGEVSIQGRSTDIEIVQAQGKVIAESTNGRIRVMDVAGDTDLETVNGNVYAHMLGGVLRAQTTNGAIIAHVIRPDVKSCSLATRNGGITLVLWDGCSAQVDAHTAQGVVKSDFVVAGTQGQKRRRRLSGIIGEGRTQLTMDTLNGNIWIARSGS